MEQPIRDLREAGTSGLVESLIKQVDDIGDPKARQLVHRGENGQTIWLDEESDGAGQLCVIFTPMSRSQGVSARDAGRPLWP